jgi:hypothetical protein
VLPRSLPERARVGTGPDHRVLGAVRLWPGAGCPGAGGWPGRAHGGVLQRGAELPVGVVPAAARAVRLVGYVCTRPAVRNIAKFLQIWAVPPCLVSRSWRGCVRQSCRGGAGESQTAARSRGVARAAAKRPAPFRGDPGGWIARGGWRGPRLTRVANGATASMLPRQPDSKRSGRQVSAAGRCGTGRGTSRRMASAVTANVCLVPPRPLWLWAGSWRPIWSAGDSDLV